MGYGVLGVGAIGAAIVTGLCDDVDDAPRVLLSPRNAEITAGLAQRFAAVRGRGRQPGGCRRRAGRDRVRRHKMAQTVLTELRFPLRPHRDQRDGGRAGENAPAAGGAGHGRRARDPAPGRSAARRHHAGPSAERRGHSAVRSTGRDGRACRRQGIRSVLGLDGDDRRVLRLPEQHHSLGRSQEIPAPAARRYVASMFAGLAEATRSGAPLEQLAREHATKGGINEQFLNWLEEGGTFEHVGLGLQRVLDRLNAT